ncbi:MAG: hypothetical protein ACK5P5_12235 [Pseudobdellovibrionaceae bacterium]
MSFFATLKNKNGFLTADYLFSFIAGFGLFMIIFGITMTLTVTEVVQYIAFSTSRAQASSHVDRLKQEAMARNKFNELKKNQILNFIFSSGWFDVKLESIRSGGADNTGTNGTFSDDYPDRRGDIRRVPAVGVRIQFETFILSQKNPILGNSSDGETPFQAKITGLMIREPSQAECAKQTSYGVRYLSILRLDETRYSHLGTIPATTYIPLEDNGC